MSLSVLSPYKHIRPPQSDFVGILYHVLRFSLLRGSFSVRNTETWSSSTLGRCWQQFFIATILEPKKEHKYISFHGSPFKGATKNQNFPVQGVCAQKKSIESFRPSSTVGPNGLGFRVTLNPKH